MTEEDTETSHCCCSKRICIGTFAIVLLLTGIAGVTVTCFILEQKVLKFNHHYGVIFDAGSSHTDVTVYQWPSQYKDHGTARTKELKFTNCSNHGISSFDENPEKAGDMITKCIETVVLKVLPHKDVRKTPVYLGATAGMRLLCARNNATCDKILDSIRQAFKKFTFRQTQDRVQVLTGQEEASFGWVSANLMNGALKNVLPIRNNSLLTGALDMGGGSAEIAFLYQEDSIPQEESFNVTLYGIDYSLYSHSYLCYGFNEARRQLLAHLVEDSNMTDSVLNPCYNRGYNATKTAEEVWLAPCSKKPTSDMFPLNSNVTYKFVGTGQPGKCERETQKLFNKTYCPYPYKNCTFNGVYQPKLVGKFLAYSGFGKTARFINVTSEDNLLTFNKAAREFCNKSWEEIPAHNVAANICFQAIYTNTFLTYGLKFPENTQDISFVDKIDGAEVGWSLGFMANKTNSIPTESPTYRISQQEFVILLLVSSLLTIIGLAMLVICIVKRKMEKNMKYKYSVIQ